MRTRIALATVIMAGASLGLAATGPTGAGASRRVEVPGPTPAGPLPADAIALMDPEVTAPNLPDDPNGALAGAVEALGAALGVPLDAGPALVVAGLAPATAGRLAVLTEGLLDCFRFAAPARAAVLAGQPGGAPPATARALRRCATPLQSAALETSAHLRSQAPAESGGEIDLWPVLRYSPGSSSNTYEHDYALLVDSGGNDTYLNNAGGNLLDLQRGPVGSASVKQEKARGCHTLGLDFPGECFAGVALLIDAAGDDTYGAMEGPDPTDDGFCTADPLVRRIVLGGAALAGVGILLDSAGDDDYLAKTISLGSGHAGGVGILRDEAGNDSYVALRNAQGYALAGGLGLLSDRGGNDVFDYYELAPLDPGARFQRPKSGGVVDDRGLCDNIPRQVQGTGFLPGSIGIFENIGGSDSYRGAPPALQDPGPPFTDKLVHSSQGYGGNGGVGYFLDEGGRDGYTGVPNRYDDLVVNPSPESSGFFQDKGSIEGGASGTPK